jgi:hypothetical protein
VYWGGRVLYRARRTSGGALKTWARVARLSPKKRGSVRLINSIQIRDGRGQLAELRKQLDICSYLWLYRQFSCWLACGYWYASAVVSSGFGVAKVATAASTTPMNWSRPDLLLLMLFTQHLSGLHSRISNGHRNRTNNGNQCQFNNGRHNLSQ